MSPSRPVCARLGQLLCLLTALLCVGGHWAVVRSVVLTKMAVGFREEGNTWSQAWGRALRGDAPCDWCDATRAVSGKESSETTVSLKGLRFEVPPPETSVLCLEPSSRPLAWPLAASGPVPVGVSFRVRSVPRGSVV